ncbi:ketoacyl synthase domain-containing protein [Syncephalis pseudoplumigaleata]|uniref:3-oxoacyl-[acyl-carrier-protein] synthase n=1 Tax=Syncephalis pseudoplumigaleata TaxID=1712513 RepID=A0A4P9Z3N7_9FUNG|nr:ketoacyl synthase domain-containing protein [Syncephalis pseudoplumigaleata]|eukprot:RKP27154.1 ketoacyl synthase domain-containing protein [Syncephalis pseudoplumigaleata]
MLARATASPARRRVVVTGLGVVCPLGVGVAHAWPRLLAGASGVVSLTGPATPPHLAGRFDGLPSTVAAVVPRGHRDEGKFSAADWFDGKMLRYYATFTQYALVAAQEALQDAHWHDRLTDRQKERTGICIGSGMGGLDDIYESSCDYHKRGIRPISPFFAPRMLVNMPAGQLSIKYGFRGPNHAVATACTTGAHAIGDASRFIQYGDADVMVAGGTEACVHPLAMAAFARARSLSTCHNDNPTKASRPFDRDRDGFVIGEGAGVVVLEVLEHARRRGARIYAEITGYGLSGDAYHMTAPPPDGSGAALAMRRAIDHAGLHPGDIDYVNAHATSTPIGDVCEHRAIRATLLGDEAQRARIAPLAVSSCKGSIGHLLGAAGAVEGLFSILAVHHNTLPPTANLEHPSAAVAEDNGSTATADEPFDLDYVPGKGRERSVDAPLRHVLSNSFGFGGTNASLCFSQYIE